MTIARMIGTVIGIGRLPYGGLLAAAAAIPIVWALHFAGGFPLVALATLSAGAKTLWAAPRLSAETEAEAVVSDRLTGQMLALWPLSGGLWFAGVEAHVFPYPGWVGAFVLCQGLLWWRPGPIGRASQRGPLWDDVLAGAIAAVITLVAAGISHGWLG